MTTTSQATQAPEPEAIPPELRIVEWQNEWIVRSAYEHDYQPRDDMLVELREKYELDAVVAGGRTEWEQMLLLKEWVRNRWDHGWSREPEARNALEILEAASGGSDFNCGYYSITMMQSLLALGFVARRAGIAKAQTGLDGPGRGQHRALGPRGLLPRLPQVDHARRGHERAL